jgi:hypothetical protein
MDDLSTEMQNSGCIFHMNAAVRAHFLGDPLYGVVSYVCFVISSMRLYDLELGSLKMEIVSVMMYCSHDLALVL